MGKPMNTEYCWGLKMVISGDLLEKTCKEMIETILLALSHATKGTIYRIGPMPELRAIRVTSGVRAEAGDEIQWGVRHSSSYGPPGKIWEEYKDRPGQLLEAMGWCVEKQKSWTADNPHEDQRSVRKQLKGEIEDFHHMEPVLVRKDSLHGSEPFELQYPSDWQDRPIWKDSEYVVVAVIKIHFLPYTIMRGDSSTRIIKKLSRTLGTELISLHMRETSLESQRQLARQRLQSCNILAHELRNTLVKLGFVSSAINAEISFLREQWEAQLERAYPGLERNTSILTRLNQLLARGLPGLNGAEKLMALSHALLAEQNDLIHLFLTPQQNEKWLENRIRPKWDRLLEESEAWEEQKEEIHELLDRLKTIVWIGMDEELARKVIHIPEDLRDMWHRLAYIDFTLDQLPKLDEILRFLDHPDLTIPHKHQTKKVLTALKVLAEMIPEVEERSNTIISALKNGTPLDEA